MMQMQENHQQPAATVPLSPEQRAVLAMHAGDAGAIVSLTASITGELDIAGLRAAVAIVMNCHGGLRHAFSATPGYRDLRQEVLAPTPGFDWQVIELPSAVGAAHPDSEPLPAPEPLAVALGQLARVTLTRYATDRHALTLMASVIAADGASLRILFNQIGHVYAGGQWPEEPGVFQHIQFIDWRQDLADNAEAIDGRAYWSRYLADIDGLPPPHLAYRQTGSTRALAPHRAHAYVIDAALAARIADCASALGYAPAVLLQALWWLLLARLTGLPRFAGGWQHDCRDDYQVMQGAVGVFEKVLPVVVELEDGTPFNAWLNGLAATLARHIEAQEYFAIEAPASLAHLAVGFAWATPITTLAGWSLDAPQTAMPCFELALHAQLSGQGGQLTLLADPTRYGHLAQQRLMQQLVTLVEAVLAQPSAAVGSLPLVGPAERAALLALNGAAVDFGTGNVAARIAGWATSTPDAPAIEFGQQVLGYRQLDAAANRMAHWMQAQGAGANSLVALNLPRSADMLVAMLAAWRIGAAYLPLEPEWPPARRAALLADAAPALLLQATSAESGGASWRVAGLDTFDASAFSALPPVHANASTDLAYVLYTSGSTGQPKGVAIEHGALFNYVAAASQAMCLATSRRWALTSSVAADLGNTALFGAWFNGACVVVAEPGDTKDADLFARFMTSAQIDGLKIVPSHLEALLECPAPRLPRTLVLGGEPAARALIERILALAPDCTIHNHYGPTETTVGVLIHAVDAKAALADTLPLSRPLANNFCYVLDRAMQLVATGAIGQLHIGGAQLCRGYLNRPSEPVFVSDPYRPGALLYRTGDLAYALPEGGIRLAGRTDHQVKVRGFRVELTEVEARLLADPEVRQAVVLAMPKPSGDIELVAVVVSMEVAGQHATQVTGLAQRMAAQLPAHMLPVRYASIATLPRLANGKIDRQALAAQIVVAPAYVTPARVPSTALEALLADCAARLLGREAVSIDDDFFDLGGHSLLAIKLVARIRKLLQVELAPGMVFDHPSVAAMAAALRQDHPDPAGLEELARIAMLDPATARLVVPPRQAAAPAATLR